MMTSKADLTIKQLIDLYERSNQAEGKSPKTVSWYSDILGLFADYLHDECGRDDISMFTKDTVRNYILYLRFRDTGLPHQTAKYQPKQSRDT
ncbi:hypothetical protein ACFLYF_04765 [Chloroflexota bacterium]